MNILSSQQPLTPVSARVLLQSTLVLLVVSSLLLVAGCRTPEPLEKHDSVKSDIARLNRILGINARNYTFQLQPNESLAVVFHAQKNGVDVRDDTFTHVVDFKTYEHMNRNYPAFEPLEGNRQVDVEILASGHTWNPDRVKVSVRLPDIERYFYYEKPTSSRTQFSEDVSIVRNRRNTLLDINYKDSNGDVQTLTVVAEIRPNK